MTVAAGESGVRLRELQGCVVHKLCMGTPSKSVVVNGIIERVVLIQVDGLGPTAYLKHSEELRTLSAFPMAHQLKLPGTNAFVNNPATNLLSSPLTKAQKAGGSDLVCGRVSAAMPCPAAMPPATPCYGHDLPPSWR